MGEVTVTIPDELEQFDVEDRNRVRRTCERELGYPIIGIRRCILTSTLALLDALDVRAAERTREKVMGEPVEVTVRLSVPEAEAVRRESIPRSRLEYVERHGASEHERTMCRFRLAVLDALDARDAERWVPEPGDWFCLDDGERQGPWECIAYHRGDVIAERFTATRPHRLSREQRFLPADPPKGAS